MDGQCHAPFALLPGQVPSTNCTEGRQYDSPYSVSFTSSHVSYSICLSMCCRWSRTQDANTEHVKQTPWFQAQRWVSQIDNYVMLTVCCECLFCGLSALHCQDDLRLDVSFALSATRPYTEACRQHVAVDSLCPRCLCHVILFTYTKHINIYKTIICWRKQHCCQGHRAAWVSLLD